MLIVDRIEDGTAVIEDDENRIEVPAESLAPDVKEGDVVVRVNGLFTADRSATAKRREEIIKLQNSLWE